MEGVFFFSNDDGNNTFVDDNRNNEAKSPRETMTLLRHISYSVLSLPYHVHGMALRCEVQIASIWRQMRGCVRLEFRLSQHHATIPYESLWSESQQFHRNHRVMYGVTRLWLKILPDGETLLTGSRSFGRRSCNHYSDHVPSSRDKAYLSFLSLRKLLEAGYSALNWQSIYLPNAVWPHAAIRRGLGTRDQRPFGICLILFENECSKMNKYEKSGAIWIFGDQFPVRSCQNITMSANDRQADYYQLGHLHIQRSGEYAASEVHGVTSYVTIVPASSLSALLSVVLHQGRLFAYCLAGWFAHVTAQ